ncbi:MAG: DUF4234 domain-containing protein [bacterium]
MYPNQPTPSFGQYSQYKRDIGMVIVYTIITCGIYDLFLQYNEMMACNRLVGREEFDFGKFLLFSIITCGIYTVYYQYCMGTIILEIQRNQGKVTFENLPLVSLLGSIFGGSFIIDLIHQNELNKLCD